MDVLGWLAVGYESLSLWNVILWLFLLVLFWLAYKAVVEPFISPLRKVPGMPYTNPFLGNMRFLMTGQAIEASMKMVKQYGALVRYYFMFGRERLLVADPDILKYLLVTNARNYVKPDGRLRLMKVVLGNGLVTSEGAIHAIHKRLLSPAFNSQSIAKMVPVFERCIQKLVDFWSERIADSGSQLLAVHADISRTNLDIIGLTAFGYEFNSLVDPEHKITIAFHSILTGAGLSWRTVVPLVASLPFPEALRFKKNLRIMDDIVRDIISKKREQLSKGADVTSDVLGMMMIARDEEVKHGMTDEELRDQVMTLMLAGHETTAVAMAWCLLMLATNQRVQTKARDEITSVIGPSDKLTYEVLDQLEYCGCVVKETLRFLPPVPLTLREALQPDTLPGDVYLPAGTILCLSVGPMMRREELYLDADTFVPERFMQKDTTDSSKYEFAPFLHGPRKCLGYRFALVEMRAWLAILLQHFQFDLDPSGPTYERNMTLTMRPSPPLHLRVSRVAQE